MLLRHSVINPRNDVAGAKAVDDSPERADERADDADGFFAFAQEIIQERERGVPLRCAHPIELLDAAINGTSLP